MGRNFLCCWFHHQIPAHAQVEQERGISHQNHQVLAAASNILDMLTRDIYGELWDTRVSQSFLPQNHPRSDGFAKQGRLFTRSQTQVPGNRFYFR